MKKILIALLVLITLAPVNAGFFDDSFEDNEQRDRGPFYMKFKDTLNNGDEVSLQERKLRITLFFLRTYYDNINGPDDSSIERFFNNALSIKKKLKSEDSEAESFDIDFKYKNLPDPGGDRYSRVVFESENITVKEAQKLNFIFDIRDFANDINLTNNNSDYKKSFSYKPIVLEISSIDFSPSIETVDGAKVITLLGKFKTSFNLNPEKQEFILELLRKGKQVKTTAKNKKRKIKFNPILVDGSSLTELGSGSEYEIKVPFKLALKKSKDIKKYKPGISYKLNLPLQIQTETDSGLEFRVKTIVKEDIADFIN